MEGGWADRGALWREKARALQLRLRERFRVVVARPSRWRRAPEGEGSYYSATLQRLVSRAVGLFEGASPWSSQPSPSGLYRKRGVSEDVDGIDDSIVVRLLQAVAVPVIGNACHVFMHGLNHVQIYGAEKLHTALSERPKGKPLLTVSNHVASVDDPFVIASLLPPNLLLDAHNLRWTLCATDRCFRNSVLSAFFRCCKVLPVSRGDGVYQKGMDMALSKLNNGGWVHIFPEGSRSRDGGRTIASSKRGVGRLVMDADDMPIVIPFVHMGMQEIMPVGSHFPRLGKKVTVLVGDPIQFEDLFLSSHDAKVASREALYDAVSSRIGHRLRELKMQVEELALEHKDRHNRHVTQFASELWQHADWEAFGMATYLSKEEDSVSFGSEISAYLQRILHPTKRPKIQSHSITIGFSYNDSIVSRMRSYMNPTELMGFAAKGLVVSSRTLKERYNTFEAGSCKRVGRFLEVNVLQQWNTMVRQIQGQSIA
ncbi:hypothetical protein Taro_030677 [Colocasia esculenta]|uniref:Phospholipid/glycerol acyltransferase domain-containing protein n=1 Tax=Colocasia esculenta TaxID=4460 RepID=A0A843VLZ0_COLES|nr:hypothetical protein [Colocasia esculenta]